MVETREGAAPRNADAEAAPKRWMSVDEALKLARDLMDAGRLTEAEKVAQDVANGQGRNADAFHLIGIVAYRQGRLDRAIKFIEKAIELAPRTAAFHANLAEMYRLRGKTEPALAACERAVALDSRNSQAWNNFGIIHYDRGDFAKAEECYRKALAGNPQFAHAWNNLGNALVRLEREGEAHDAFQRAIALQTNYSEAMVNDGLNYREEGEFGLAAERLQQAIEANPKNANARISLAMLRMLQGDLKGGLAEYEWRLAMPGIRPRNLPGQLWRGEPIEGKRIFVHCEQGLGDTIHYLRFLKPLAARRPGAIILQTQASLQRLAELNFPFVEVVRSAPASDGADFHCALMSLPLLLSYPVERRDPQDAYLSAPGDQVEIFRNRFAGKGGLKVGLVWAGNTAHKYDYSRSMPAERLLPLLKVEGCHFYSLQIGSKPADAVLFKEGVTDLSKDVSNMMSTAAAIAALDLVIGVDTSLIHLAGALGTPVWTMLSRVPDWRWGLGGDTTPLYSSMRLFRQKQRRDWPGIVQDVAAALEQTVAARRQG